MSQARELATFASGDFPHGATISGQTGAGHILQVQAIAKTDTFSTTIAAGAVADITDMTLKLTPVSSSNKILIMTMINGGTNLGGRESSIAIRLQRDSSNIAMPTGTTSNRPASWLAVDINGAINDTSQGTAFGMFFDSPSTTSEIVYKLQFLNGFSSSVEFYLNRCQSDSDDPFRNRTISTMTIMEVQG